MLHGRDVMANLPDRFWQRHDFFYRLRLIVVYEKKYHFYLTLKTHRRPNFRSVIAELYSSGIVVWYCALFLSKDFDMVIKRSLPIDACIYLNHQKVRSRRASLPTRVDELIQFKRVLYFTCTGMHIRSDNASVLSISRSLFKQISDSAIFQIRQAWRHSTGFVWKCMTFS